MNSENQYFNLLEMPIAKIIKNQNEIELNIIDDLKKTITIFLVEYGYTYDKGIFTLVDERYELTHAFLENSRTLVISLKNMIDKTHKTSKKHYTVNGFGMIRSFDLELPKSSFFDIDRVGETLKSQIISAYTALEQAIIRDFETLERKVFEKLYDCLAYQFKISNKKQLLGRFWLFIAEEDEGLYFFDKKNIEQIIEHYKSNQIETLSPLQLTIWIMTAPLPYKESLAFQAKQEGRPLSLNWKNAKYIGEAKDIFRAEVALYNSEEYTGYTICESRGFFLVIGCPSEIAGEIFPEISKVEENLKHYFTAGLKEWSPFFKLVKKISQHPDISNFTENFGRFLASFGAEIAKKYFIP